MRRLLLALALALPGAARADAPAELDAPYEAKAPLPDGFERFLKERGCAVVEARVRRGDKTLSRREVDALLLDFFSPGPGAPSLPQVLAAAPPPPPPQGPAAPADAGALFDGSGKKAAAAPVTPGDKKKKEKPKDRRGLRVLGLELGGTEKSRPAVEEPYTSKGTDRLLDWDIRLRLPLDGLGLRTIYRHPRHVRAFSLTALKYWDWPGELGGDVRDGAYASFGSVPEKPKGGFQVGAGTVLDAHWGLNASYDDKTAETGQRWFRSRAAALGGGWSPLGDNPGKTWNYTLTGALDYSCRERRDPAVVDDRCGVGYVAGVVFQKALDKVATPWLDPVPVFGHGVLRFERLRTTSSVAQSELSSVAMRQAVELSFYLGKYLELTPGVWAQWRPKPIPGDPDEKEASWGGLFGLDVKNVGF